jgi:hypothetical protein
MLVTATIRPVIESGEEVRQLYTAASAQSAWAMKHLEQA